MDKLKQIVVATRNKGKLREFSALLAPLGLSLCPLPEDAPEPIENGHSFAENAAIKALSAMQHTGLAALADDSGLCVDALEGAPGIYSARYCDGTDADRTAFLLEKMQDKQNRACHFACALCLVYPDGRKIEVEGRCEGELLHAPQGQNGFGYDPVFYLPQYQKSMAEVSDDIKNQLSHRAAALRRLVQVFQSEEEQWS